MDRSAREPGAVAGQYNPLDPGYAARIGEVFALAHREAPVFFSALLGGFASGLRNGRLRLVTTKGPNISNRTRWVMAFLGGVIFLYGARLARGCTSGQALSGGATLAAGSWVVMLAIFASAYLLAYIVRKLWL